MHLPSQTISDWSVADRSVCRSTSQNWSTAVRYFNVQQSINSL